MIDLIYNIESEFDDVFHKLTSDKILNRKDTSELPIYIQTYPIRYEDEVNDQIVHLKDRLCKSEINTLHIDVYLLILELLEEDGILVDIFENESEIDKIDLLGTLCEVLNHNRVMQRIIDRVDQYNPKLVLLSGFASLYPYIRTNSILNNIHPIVNNFSAVFFYPGRYNNESLVLFDEIEEENYYRAHNLSMIKIEK